MHAFIFGFWVLNLFAAPSEVESQLIYFCHNLSFIVKSSLQPDLKKKQMKQISLISIPKFNKKTLLRGYLSDKKREIQNALFEIGDFQKAAFTLP